MSYLILSYAAMLTISFVASLTDLKSGMIPNWLTFPALLFAPVLTASFGGLRGFCGALLGIVICGIVPVIFHRLGAMGGGDVKLFAALGGLGGPGLGLEIELMSLSLAFLWGTFVLAYRGQLFRSLSTSGALVLNVFLPAKRRRVLEPTEMTSLRIGAAIFAGTALAIASHTILRGFLP